MVYSGLIWVENIISKNARKNYALLTIGKSKESAGTECVPADSIFGLIVNFRKESDSGPALQVETLSANRRKPSTSSARFSDPVF